MYGQSQGDYLNERADDWEDHQEQMAAAMATTREQMRKRYAIAKAAKVGDKIECAFCGHKLTKTSYHQAFCSSGKGHHKCKDQYHNSVSSKRRERRKRWW